MNYAHIKGPGDFAPRDEIEEFDEDELVLATIWVVSEWMKDKEKVSEYLQMLDSEYYDAIDAACANGDSDAILYAMKEGMAKEMAKPAREEAKRRIRKNRLIEKEEQEIYSGSSDYD